MDRIRNEDKVPNADTRGFAYQSETQTNDFSIAPPPLQLKVAEDSAKGDDKELKGSSEKKQSAGSGELPTDLKSGVESLSGYSLSDVKVHYNSNKPQQLSADAFAQGTDIHVGPGQEKHLPHEAWHVVQQKQGRVKPTYQAKGGTNINDDTSLESEADQMGQKAQQLKLSTNNFGANLNQSTTNRNSTAQLSLQAEIIKFANKIGVAKNIEAIAQYYGITKSRAHSILSTTDTDTEKISALEESSNKIKASAMELDDEARTGGSGGHAIARHGPEISNAALEKRLYSGMAPDNALSPAPGSSSKFKTYTAMIQTRQAASAALQSEIVKAQGNVLKWKNTQIRDNKLKVTDDAMKSREIRKRRDFQKADASHTELMGKLDDDSSLGPTVPASIKKKNAAQDKMDTAIKNAITSGEDLLKPGKHLIRLWPSHSKLDLDINEDANEGMLEDNVKMKDKYLIVVKHDDSIGEGFKSDDSIKLSDLVKQVATNPDAEDNVDLLPKTLPNIKSALTALTVGGDIDEFAAYLSDAANLKTARKKGKKGGKIYRDTNTVSDLYKTTTNLQVDGDKKLFRSNLGSKEDKPIKVHTAKWPAIQHFPAAEDAEEGLKKL